MPRPVTYTFIAASTTYIAAAQTLAGSGNLVINGSGVDNSSSYWPRVWMRGLGFSRPVTLTSTGNLSGINFTVTGTDIRGAILVEVIAGPNNNTVSTTGLFYSITQISANAAVATAVSAGIGTTGTSQWFRVDYLLNPTNIGLGITVVSGTINWTVQQTTYDVEPAEPPAAAIINNSDTNLVTQTVSRQGNYVVDFNASHLVVNSSSGGGNLVWNIYQGGISQS